MNQLVLGTWQFALKDVEENEIRKVINYALNNGIEWFDTAEVYGGGKIENILGEFPCAKVISKIPAKIKPQNSGSPLCSFYTEEYIEECCKISCERLKRPVDILLLHNWVSDWNTKNCLFEWMHKMKAKGYCREIGVSIPDNYDGLTIPFRFDWIMASLNSETDWIESHYKELCPLTKVAIRSIYNRGKDVPVDVNIKMERMRRCEFAEKIVIGMTRNKTIDENIQLHRRIFENNEENRNN